jgi:galactose oxidase-like protein/Kelch motif protein
MNDSPTVWRLSWLVWAVSVVAAIVVPGRCTAGSLVGTHPMLEPRSGHSATLLKDGTVLVAGGMRRNGDLHNSAELYDPVRKSFRATGAMAVARVGHVAVLLNTGRVLIAGGYVTGGCTDSAELYDPSTQTFTSMSSMTSRRGRPTATLLATGDVLIAGGADHDAPGGIASAEVFRSASQAFVAVAPMHDARVGHTATSLRNGRVLIAGGRGERAIANAEFFDPITEAFVVTGSLAKARYKHTAGRLPDGRVLVAGGSDERDWHGTLRSAEVYDPRSGLFTSVGPLADARFKMPGEAVVVSDGRILVAGGATTVEVFDPATSQFTVALGRMNSSWHYGSETLLADGTVLIAGGYPDNDRATANSWLFAP